mmetsp:Transcript_10091/g.13486  ORF Transcript_10091/g.13486 Transcript_10091/m.13486 type:complete len:334 (+) Transcript_10091:311-1312(+)
MVVFLRSDKSHFSFICKRLCVHMCLFLWVGGGGGKRRWRHELAQSWHNGSVGQPLVARAPIVGAVWAEATGSKVGAAFLRCRTTLADNGRMQIDRGDAVARHNGRGLRVEPLHVLIRAQLADHGCCDCKEELWPGGGGGVMVRVDGAHRLGLLRLLSPGHQACSNGVQLDRVDAHVALLSRYGHVGVVVEAPVEHDGVRGPLAAVWRAQKVDEALQAIGRLLSTAVATPRRVLNQCCVGHGGGHKGRVPDADRVANHEHVRPRGVRRKLRARLAHAHTQRRACGGVCGCGCWQCQRRRRIVVMVGGRSGRSVVVVGGDAAVAASGHTCGDDAP